MNIFSDTLNYRKLKEVRIARNMSLTEVAEKVGITEATLSRYESGKIRNIPLETVQKIAAVYKYDYQFFYGLSSLPFFSSVIGIIISSIYIISPLSLLNGATIGYASGFFIFDFLRKYYEKDKIKSEDMKVNLYMQLNEDEKEEYETFKAMNYSFLKTKKLFSKAEIEENEGILLAYYFAHKVRRENKVIDITQEEIKEVKE